MTGNSQQGWRRFVVPALIVGTAVVGGLAFMGAATDAQEQGAPTTPSASPTAGPPRSVTRQA